MNYKIVCSLTLTLLLLTPIGASNASTSVSGPIFGNVTWTLAGSPYIVVGGISITEGARLTINPGVVVKFDKGFALQVDGELIAKGTADSRITFTANQAGPAPGDWGYILFRDTSTDAVYDGAGNYVSGSLLEYCIVEFGGYPANGGAVRIEASSPFIHCCQIRNNISSGIQITNMGAPTIAANEIYNNSARVGGGIVVHIDDGAIIVNNIIRNNYASSNGGGIDVTTSRGAVISNNLIIGNKAGGAAGAIYATVSGLTSSPVIISKNIIQNNASEGGGGGLFCDGDLNSGQNYLLIYDNFVINNSSRTHVGGGIWAYRATITNNVVAGNILSGKGGGLWSLTCKIEKNSIVNNTCNRYSLTNYLPTAGATINAYDPGIFSYNTVTGNIVPQTSDSGGVTIEYNVDINYSVVANYNNIFNNFGLQFYNQLPQRLPSINAVNCYWGTADESIIREKIYDWFDDASRGIVDFIPYQAGPNTTCPISPPAGFKAVGGKEGVSLTWTANPEADKAGYRVYWGSVPGYPYANVVDAGNFTSFFIKGPVANPFYVTVTAYDLDYRAANDDPATLVNENQVNGNESWFAPEQVIDIRKGGIPAMLQMLLLY